MDISKVVSTVIILAENGNRYRIEINKHINTNEHFAVFYVQQDMETEKYGRCPAWCEISSYIQLGGIDIPSCENQAISFLTDQLG